MKESLLRYYQDELSYLRKQGENFAKAYPKVAGKLKLTPEMPADPFVERMLEAFAFLTARVHHKIDNQLSTIAQSMLSVLYPQYLMSIPSFSTIELSPQTDFDDSLFFEKGESLYLVTSENKKYQFSTGYPTHVQPIYLSEINYKQNMTRLGKSKLSFKLSTINESKKINALTPHDLRMYINLPIEKAFLLLNLCIANTVCINVRAQHEPLQVVDIDTSRLTFVGYSDAETCLPMNAQMNDLFSNFQLYFTYPNKFLFIELKEILGHVPDNSIYIDIYFNEYIAELTPYIDEKSLLLNCTPIVNHFETCSVPIRLDHKISDYAVIPDCENADEIEVHQIKALEIITENEAIVSRPVFGYRYNDDIDKVYLNWWYTKKSCEEEGLYYQQGTKSYINIAYKNNPINFTQNLTAVAKITCSHHDLPSVFSRDEACYTFAFKANDYADVFELKQIGMISAFVHKDLDEDIIQKLTALINMHHIALENNEEATRQIKSILSLISGDNEEATRIIHQGIVKLDIKPLFKRHPQHQVFGFCRGSEVALTIDKQYFLENKYIVFAKVLHVYLVQMSAINHFIELVLLNKDQQEIMRCPAEIGKKQTL